MISVENITKSYRLGQIGTGTLTNDLKVWAAQVRGKPNPMLKIGQTDHGNMDGETLWALKDVTFQVEQGEVLGIIGRNGAGKSTLLKILSRVTAPTSGQIKVKGRIASLLEVGTGFHPDLTGRENIYLNGAILGMTKEEVRCKFDEIVAFAEIEKFIDTPVKRYSSGMYVRLAFAVAAHLNSENLLVDEVLAVGDAEFQKKCLGKMGDIASKEGRTVLFVSHNMGSIKTLCQRGIVIDKGQIILDDTQSSAIQHYFQMFEKFTRQEIITREDRKGDGRIRLTEIKILDNCGTNKTNLLMGEPFKVQMGYSATGEFDVKNIEFTLVCSNSIDMKVFMQKVVFPSQYENLPRKGEVAFIPAINYLAPGDYFFRVVIRYHLDVCDLLDHAMMFTILTDTPKQGVRLLPSNQSGICLMDGRWELIDCEKK